MFDADPKDAAAPALVTPTVNTVRDASEPEDPNANLDCVAAIPPNKSMTDWNAISAFMAAVVPWPASSNDAGWVNLHWSFPDKNSTAVPKTIVLKGGKPNKEIADFIKDVKWRLQRPEAFKDMFFCTSLQRDHKTSPNGTRRAAKSGAAALALKSIWVDVDVKAGDPKHYHTEFEALKAILLFAKTVGLPDPSAIVRSGGGLHIYWISREALTPQEWLPYAQGLKTLLLANNVLADTVVTTDAARILRVPGTLNHKPKYPQPMPVELVDGLPLAVYDFPQQLMFLQQFAGPTVAPTAAPAQHSIWADDPTVPPGARDSFKSGPAAAFTALKGEPGLQTGINKFGDTLLAAEPIFRQCGFLRDALLNGGKDYDNPLWNLSVLCTAFMENGNDYAHAISSGHATYTQADTQALYDRKVADRVERGLGWPRCATIHGAGCTSCATCPFFALGKSPLHLTGPITATVNPGSTTAAPATWSQVDLKVTFSNIRHRRTLYGHDLVRGEITVLGSPGGVGKSSLAIGMGVSIATGKTLLEEKIHGNDLKILLINAEDGTDEIRRRVWAFCRAHGVSEQELDRLFVAGADHPCVQGLSLLRTNLKGHSELDDAGFSILKDALQAFSPDVVVLDPLVALCAGGNMNDNASMSLVMRALKRLAAEFDCAALIVHHTRKGGDIGSADAISGAASIVNLARRAIMPVPLSAEEAAALGILPSERPSYFKLVDAKSNLAPRSIHLPFYRLHSVALPNAEPPTYPFGDNVQAVVRVLQPSQTGGPGSTDDQKIRQAILDLVNRGKTIDGKVYPYSPNTAGAANERSIMKDAVATAQTATAPRQWVPGDLEALVKAMIKTMQEEGALASRAITGAGRFRRGQGLHADPALITDGDVDATDTDIVA